ncbi:MAG: hypothetical protein ONB30_04595 [candidate division KSB1 bacterium]|nr:hypothetical protein [candidate division KSB1 bacterium]
MSTKAGLWIDHQKATIVYLEEQQESTRVIESQVEPRIRVTGGSRSVTPYGPQESAAERKRDERRKHQLEAYYAQVIDALRQCEEVYVFGPGAAKGELKKAMERAKDLHLRLVAVEPADKMTPQQIAAKVRAFFGKERRVRRR